MIPLLLAIVAQANPVWAERLNDAGLSGSERTCFANVVTAAAPTANPTNIDYLHWASGASLELNYRETVATTAAQYAADELAGIILDPNAVTWNASVATYQRVQRITMTPAQLGSLYACVVLVWPAAGAPQSLTIERRAGPTFPASLDHHVTGTPAQYVAARAAGLVVRRIQ